MPLVVGVPLTVATRQLKEDAEVLRICTLIVLKAPAELPAFMVRTTFGEDEKAVENVVVPSTAPPDVIDQLKLPDCKQWA